MEFSSSKAGVGIVFNNNFQLNILKCYTDPEGRFIIVDVETKDIDTCEHLRTK